MTPLLWILILSSLAACSFVETRSIPVQPLPTATTLRVIQTTPVPTVNRQMHDVPTAPPRTEQPEPTATTPVDRCEDSGDGSAARHTVVAELSYRDQTVAVQQVTRYVNRGDDALHELVMDVEPNRLPGAFTLGGLTLAGLDSAPSFELTGRRLTIDLAQPLGLGCSVEIHLDFNLRIPQIGVGEDGFIGYFGFSARQINLARWLPIVAVRRDGEWLLHDNTNVGEQTVADPADWDVTLKVVGASDKLEVVGPGAVSRPEPGMWQFVHTGARDFALSMSEEFLRSSREAENGVTVELYTFPDAIVERDGLELNGPQHALEVAARSLAMYADLFGPYPYDRLVIVQGDFPDGMEFSGLVFVSEAWFRTYEGQPTGYLTIITVHEVAHQWWYARVGNDQAMTPWLDEALATYSEYVYYEEYHPNLRDWWWRFRVDAWVPQEFDDDPVDSTVYDFGTVRQYINAVYLRGARMLHALRSDLGTDAFFTWLRKYADAASGKIASPDMLWSQLTPAQREATRATREAFLSHVDSDGNDAGEPSADAA